MVYMYFRRQFEAIPAYNDVTTVAQNTGILDNACEGRALKWKLIITNVDLNPFAPFTYI